MRNILTNKKVAKAVRTRVLSLLERRRNGKWQGTMTDLLLAITGSETPEVWPGSPSSLRRIVDRVAPSIRRAGFKVEFSRTTDHNRKRVISFTRRPSK